MAKKLPASLFLSEFIGTALLVAAGVSVVILDFGAGSPVASAIPDSAVRRALTGLLFGTVGTLITLSPVGKVSGAHINPAVTLAFRVKGKMGTGHAAGYLGAQLAGGAAGALPLLLWGPMGASVSYGATVPGPSCGPWAALLGEIAATTCLIGGLFVFLGHARLRRFTPALFAPLYALMVWLEAPLSGTSTNPARSLGPSLVSGAWGGWWIYWLGPAAGTLLALLLLRVGPLRRLEADVAKVYHFRHDPHGVFRPRPYSRRAGSPESARDPAN
jgi:aquaporin Z